MKYFGNTQLIGITVPKLNDYFTHSRKKSIYLARKDLINISSAFTYAVKQDYLKENPCKYFKRFKIPEKLPLFFTERELEILLRTIDEPELKGFVEFAVQTGLRQMELLTLQWSQINFKSKILILDNRNHLTKSQKIRTLPLSNKALQILSRRMSINRSELIFTLNDKKLLKSIYRKKFKSYVLKTTINSKLNFHSLHHTFASWLVQRGVSIYEVSKLLGHSGHNSQKVLLKFI